MIPLEAIGQFRGAGQFPYDCPRQAVLDDSEGIIELKPEYAEGLRDLEGFDRIWVVFLFHRNTDWKALVHPPGRDHRVGVFASRAPYRPNPIGLSCVRLLRVEAASLHIRGVDLIDESPVLDIKPYLPYCDAFPGSATGWWSPPDPCAVGIDESLHPALSWILEQTGYDLEHFVHTQLRFNPDDRRAKRIEQRGEHWVIAYRTWRIHYDFDPAARRVRVHGISSGYSSADLQQAEDPHRDKELHRAYRDAFHR